MRRSSVNKKLKGSTLIEILIALVILSVCSALSVLICLNIQKSTFPFIKLKGMEIAKTVLMKTIDGKEYVDKRIQEDGFIIHRNIEKLEAYPDCSVIHIVVFSSENKEVAEVEQVILTAIE